MSALDLNRLCTIPDYRWPPRGKGRRLAWILRASIHDGLPTFHQHVAVKFVDGEDRRAILPDGSVHTADIELVRSPNPKQVYP